MTGLGTEERAKNRAHIRSLSLKVVDLLAAGTQGPDEKQQDTHLSGGESRDTHVM